MSRESEAREVLARALVERLAIESGEWGSIYFDGPWNPWAIAVKAVMEASEAMREACAKVAESEAEDIQRHAHMRTDTWQCGRYAMACTIAAAIRAMPAAPDAEGRHE